MSRNIATKRKERARFRASSRFLAQQAPGVPQQRKSSQKDIKTQQFDYKYILQQLEQPVPPGLEDLVSCMAPLAVQESANCMKPHPNDLCPD